MNNINKILADAMTDLVGAHNNLNKLCEDYYGTDVYRFIERALEWRTDHSKKQLFAEFASGVIDMTNHGFMNSISYFIKNTLLNDSGCGFRIEWRKFFSNVLTDKNDPESDPFIVLDINGMNDVSLIMEAMDFKLLRQGIKAKAFEKIFFEQVKPD
jgi:hypothetical protein